MIENPDGATSSNRFHIVESRSGYSDRNFLFVFTNDSGIMKCILTNNIAVITTWYVQDSVNSAWTNRFRETRSPDGNLLSKTEDTYAIVNGREVIVRTIDGDGTTTNITAYAYDSDGNLQRVDYPNGNWEAYERDYVGRITAKYSAFGNSIYTDPNPEMYGNCTKTMYSYTGPPGDDANLEPFLPRYEALAVPVNNGSGFDLQEVSRTYRSIPALGEINEWRCPAPGADWDDSANIYTKKIYDTPEDDTGSYGRPLLETHENATISVYFYQTNSAGQLTNIIELDGQPNIAASLTSTPTNVINGTRTDTAVDSLGRTTSVIVRAVINSSVSSVLSQQTYSYTGDAGSDYKIVDLAGRTNQFYFACCGLDNTVDADGVTTVYGYDSMRRRISSIVFRGGSLGIETLNVLDGLGRTLSTSRIGTNGTAIPLQQLQYDLLGRMIRQTNALNGVTTTTNVVIGSQLYMTNIYADGGIRIDQNYRDGRTQSTTGSAVHSVQYVYGAEHDGASGPWRQFTLEIHPDASGSTNEWIKTYYDGVGHAYKTIYASAISPYPYRQSFYNNLGQKWKDIDPDGVATLYQYNALGERTYTVTDMNRNDTIDFGGTDRISFATNDVVSDHGVDVRRTRNYVWATTNLDSSSLVSIGETSTDGLNTWEISWRDVNVAVTNHTTISPGTSRSEIAVVPDGSYVIRTYSYGQLVSESRYDSADNQIGGTTYGYDAHGRQNTMADVRNGTTTYTFNNADFVASVTTPDPGSGGSAQTTTTYYNTMMQATNVVQSDGVGVTNEYYLTGEQKCSYGVRTYPVAYSYDYAGRMKTMTNWSNFSGNAGPRVTTWKYDAYRGFLTNKIYDGGVAGPSYTYTDAGRLATRTWARGIVTTYSYDNAGGLSTVVHSDTTSAITNSYDRRGLQSTVTWSSVTDTMSYNLAGELLSESYSGGILNGLAVTNGYDQFMRRTNLTALASGVMSRALYSYDNASRLSTVSDGTNNAAYSYVANSPLVSQIVFTSNSVTRMTTTKSYDYLNRLNSISSLPSASSAVSFGYNYNSANQRTRCTLADGSYWIYTYDARGQVTTGHKYFYDGTPVAGQQFDYSFDDIGNRTQAKSGGDQTGSNQRTANFYANNLNQLTNRDVSAYVDIKGVSIATNVVTVNNQTAYRKWEYFRDELPANNSPSALWTNIIVAATGQTSVTGNVYVARAPELFKYDADGNLTNDGRWAYIWDGENRLIQMNVNTNVGPQYQLMFAYDSQGRRIQKTVFTNGIGIYTNQFLYDGWNLVAELGAAGSPIRSYMWGIDLSGSMRGAGGIGGLLNMSCYGVETTNYLPAFDGNGNVMALVGVADGTDLAQYEYGPFGETIRTTGPAAALNPIRFSTKFQDDESDIFYYGHRYYVPFSSRWLNRDLLEDVAFNQKHFHAEDWHQDNRMEEAKCPTYVFARNDPIGIVDRFGLKTLEVGGCEIIIFYGHGIAGHPYDWDFDSICSAGVFIGCWDAETDDRIGKHHQIPGAPTTSEPMAVEDVDKNVVAALTAARSKAQTMCKVCCSACPSIKIKVEMVKTYDPTLDLWVPDEHKAHPDETITCPPPSKKPGN